MFSPLTRAQVSFEIKNEIGGEGKNSQTFKAHDPQLDAEIVIKKIKKANLDECSYFSESRLLYASAHPNVVQIHYACEDNEHVFVAMPFYKNGSVRALLAIRYVSVREIVQIGCQILTGLHNVHSKGLVHFDIKADNVLLSDRREALISDFGLAKPLENGVATPDGIYQPNFPPEAFKTREFDARYDIFQTGLTLYCMCIGIVAYKAQFLAYAENGLFDATRFKTDISKGTYPDRNAFPPNIPARLKKVVKRCLQVDPNDRYQSALDAMNDLAQVEGNELDWVFSEQSGKNVWEKSVEDTKYVFTIRSDSSCELLKSVKGGAFRKQSDGCKTNVNPKEISRILGRY